MLRITHTRGRRAPAVEHFGGQRIRIGAAPNNEVALADAHVVPQHAEIRFENGSYLIDAIDSQDVFVNGARVKKHFLKHGDAVVVGHSPGAELRVEIVGGAGQKPIAPEQDGRVDLETAQRIVQAAVLQATSRDDPTSRIVADKVDRARRKASRANTLLTAGIGLAIMGSFVAAYFIWNAHRQAQILAVEAGLDSTAKPVAGAIPTQVFSGRQIYEANKAALYVIGYLIGNKVGGICTAFAIGPTTLATNAHCVLGIKEKGGQPVVTQNDSGGKVRFKIVGLQSHPQYNAQSDTTDTPDVGLLRVDTKMPTWVTLANDAELRAIGPGDDVYVLGFPGRVMDPISPSATFLSGHVGRTMGFNEAAVSPEKSYLVQHDAVTRGGNSGSPVFNQYGHVIAVHAAHIDEDVDQTVDGRKTTVVTSSPFRIGMRIDLLKGVPAP